MKSQNTNRIGKRRDFLQKELLPRFIHPLLFFFKEFPDESHWRKLKNVIHNKKGT